MIDGVIMACIGLFVALIGYRKIQIPASPQFDSARWFARYGRMFRITGPLLVLCGVAIALADLIR